MRELRERHPEFGIDSEVFVTAPGAEIDEAHPLVAAIDAAHEHVFGAPPERDTVRWFSDASALTRYGIETVNYGTSSGLPDPDGENLEIAGLRRIATVYALAAAELCEVLRVKLVTFEAADGTTRAGVLEGRRDRGARRARHARRCSSAAWSRPRRAAASASRSPTCACARRSCPKKFFHTAGNFREHEEESQQRRLVARDRALDRLLPERRRDHRPGRADHLPRAPDRGARLRARARGHHRQGGHAISTPREAASYIAGYTIFNDITARDIQRREMRSGVFSFCKAIDSFCPLGPGS